MTDATQGDLADRLRAQLEECQRKRDYERKRLLGEGCSYAADYSGDGCGECIECARKHGWSLGRDWANARAVVANDRLVAEYKQQRDTLRAALAEVTRELDALRESIDESLPHYVLDDGTGDEANELERVEYAGDEIRRVHRRLAEATELKALFERDRDAAFADVDRLRSALADVTRERDVLRESLRRLIRHMEAEARDGDGVRDDAWDDYRAARALVHGDTGECASRGLASIDAALLGEPKP
jgi:hypothetical protein